MSAPAPRVLVVEDDLPTSDLVTALLRDEFGAEVDAVRDGSAAIAALGARPFALLVLDLGLPDVDGLKVLRWLRTLPAAARVPTVVCTAGGADDQAAAVRLGAETCVRKPFELGALADAVRPFLTAHPSA